MTTSPISLQPMIDADSGALRIKALLGPDDDIELNSLAQLNTDYAAGSQVTLHAQDFVHGEHSYRVFAATIAGDGGAATPWPPCADGGCQYSFTIPASHADAPLFAICAAPVQASAPAPRPFVANGSGHTGGLPIEVDKPSGPGPSPD